MPESVGLVAVKVIGLLEPRVSVMVRDGFPRFLYLPNIFERRFIVSLNSGCCRFAVDAIRKEAMYFVNVNNHKLE
jgi:hypothetical protein